jgi:hypothetical protein
MISPDDSLLKTVLEWAWGGVLALIGVVWKQQQTAMTAQRKQLEAQIKAVADTQDAKNTAFNEDIVRHEDTLVRLYDKLEAHSQASNERHIELLNAIHSLKQ